MAGMVTRALTVVVAVAHDDVWPPPACAQTPAPQTTPTQQAADPADTPAGSAGSRNHAAADHARGERHQYVIGPGDTVQVFVWRNPELSVTVPVRPDGKISTPLVEDMVAVGKTPSQLAREIEKALAEYVRSPQVNIIVTNPVSTFSQVKVIGEVDIAAVACPTAKASRCSTSCSQWEV